MTPDRSIQIEQLFREALAVPAHERDTFLSRRCAGDDELRLEVESLLAFHDGEGVLDTEPDYAAFGLPSRPARERSDPEHRLVGEDVGPYRVLEFLGRGGMGLVYLAEQRQPVRRRVALKILRTSVEGSEVVARFESERQALALMDNPHIARIYDAGTTEDGRPFFTMEYVPGIPVTESCDQRKLDLQGRLRLFLGICDGVQHAHQRGILHRDLKPSNILVTSRDGVASPKIIDFGVAKALHQRLTERTLVTAHDLLVGTPEYMSPEQASTGGSDVDTRSDIYSLGALLYKLLTGRLPLERRAGTDDSLAAYRDRLVHEEPPRPSAVVANGEEAQRIAGDRGVTPRRLARSLTGELDWIVLRALEKERSHRYPAVSALADDVQHYLAGEPVAAGPPTLGYRTRKFVNKNRVVVVAVLAVMAALAAGLVASLQFAVQADRARDAAQRSAATALRRAQETRAVTELFQTMVLEASPSQGGEQDISLSQALAQAAARMDTTLIVSPEIDAAVRITWGETFRELGQMELAERSIRRGLMALESFEQPSAETLGNGLKLLGHLQSHQGRYVEADSLYRKALSVYREAYPAGHEEIPVLLTSIVGITHVVHSFDRAEQEYRSLLELQEEAEGPDSFNVATTLRTFGNVLAGNFRHDEADRVLRRALRMHEAELGPDHDRVGRIWLRLATNHRLAKEFDRAETALQKALQIFDSLPENHYRRLRVLRDLGATWAGQGHYARADSMLAATLRRQQQAGVGKPDMLRTNLFRGNAFRDWGRLEPAAEAYDAATLIAEEVYGQRQHFMVALLQLERGRLAALRGETHQAIELLEAALVQQRQLLRPHHPFTVASLGALSRCLLEENRDATAEPVVIEYFEAARQEYGEEHPETEAAAEANRLLCQRRGDEEAARRWQQWLAGDRRIFPKAH